MVLDHLILRVNDVEESVRFYTDILGLIHEGQREPFTVVRVTSDFTIQLAPWGTEGGEHLAFAMPHSEFEEVFGRIREGGIEFGDSFHAVGNMQGRRARGRRLVRAAPVRRSTSSTRTST